MEQNGTAKKVLNLFEIGNIRIENNCGGRIWKDFMENVKSEWILEVSLGIGEGGYKKEDTVEKGQMWKTWAILVARKDQ
jgi:hypothetical protein